MKTGYRFLTLVLALMMLLALFAGCQSNTENDTPDGDTANVPDSDQGTENDGDESEEGDAPEEVEAKTITWLGFEFHNYKYTAEEAKDFETFKAYMDLALNKYNLVIDWEAIDQSAYQTTINGLLAADALPDSYCGSFFPEDVYNSVYVFTDENKLSII